MRIELITHVIVLLIVLKTARCGSSDNVGRNSKPTPLMSASIAPESQPMVSAVLLECPKEVKETLNTERVAKHPRNDKQLMVNIRVNPSFHIEKVEKFLILDEVYDPRKRSKAKIMSPYLIEISRGEPVMMYPLEFSKSVKMGDEKPPPSTSTNEYPDVAVPTKDDKLEESAQVVSLNRIISKIASSISPVTKISSVEEKENQDQGNRASKAQSKQRYTLSENKRKDERRQVTTSTATQEGVRSTNNQDTRLNIGYLTSDPKYHNDLMHQSADGKSKLPSALNVGVERRLIKQLEDSTLRKSSASGSNEVNIINPKHFREQNDFRDRKDALSEDDFDEHQISRKEATKKDEEEHDLTDSSEPNEKDSNELSEKDSSVLTEKDSKVEINARVHDDGDEFGDEVKAYDRLKNAAIAAPKRPMLDSSRRQYKKPYHSQQFRKNPFDYDEIGDHDDYDMPGQPFVGSRRESVKGFRPCNCEAKSIDAPSFKSKISRLNGGHKRYRQDFADKGRQHLFGGKELLKLKSHQQVYEDDDYQTADDIELERKRTRINRNEYKHPKQALRKYFGNLDARLSRNATLTGSNPNRVSERNQLVPLSSDMTDSWLDYDDGKQLIPSKSNRRQSNKNLRSLNYMQSRGFRRPPLSGRMRGRLTTPAPISNEYERVEPLYSPNRHQPDYEKNIGYIDYDDIPKQKKITYIVTPNKQPYSGDAYIYFARPKPKFSYLNRPADGGLSSFISNYASNGRSSPFSDLNYGPLLHFEPKGAITKDERGNIIYNSLWDEPSLPYLEPYARAQQKERNLEPPATDYDDFNQFAISQAARGDTQKLLNQEPEQYLPRKVPFQRVLDDPYLNTNDKLSMIEVMNPHNDAADLKLKQLSREMEKSVFVKPYTLQVPLPSSRTLDYSNKKKRSFVFYDDLSMRDTSLDNDYNFDDVEHKSDKSGSSTRHAEEDIRPCSSCGGKNKKPPSKTDSHVSALENDCNCRNEPDSCICATRKTPRSVSDTWYSVFNMSAPLPFLTTRMRIFRKRRNTWLKIAPSITLSSLSGIFANANLSILFSSHVDIFQLEKSLRLQNHQLLIPKDNTPIARRKTLDPEEELTSYNLNNLNPNRVLALAPNSFYISQHSDGTGEDKLNQNKRYKRSDIGNFNGISGTNVHNIKSKRENQVRKNSTKGGLQSIADLGYFPVTMNFLERCPNNKHRLCLNLLDDKVPAYSIKLKMPFRENAVIHNDVHKVKITRIVTDATTKDAMQVSIDVINEGFKMQQFSIFVSNCGMSCTTAKSSVKKTLLPHIGETVTFLLPLITDSSQKYKRFTCDVLVKAKIPKKPETPAKPKPTVKTARKAESRPQKDEMKTVAFRQLVVETEKRCFCVWECNCHCIAKVETHVDFNVCQKLTFNEEKAAGLLLRCQDGEEDVCLADDDDHEQNRVEADEDNICPFLVYAFYLLCIMLLLGLLKAVIGRLCSSSVDRCGFDYAQPGKGYDDSSRRRRFFINLLFFVLFPFFVWCKCFTPSEEDLLVASTEWQCANDQSTPATSERSSKGYKPLKNSKHKNLKNESTDDENVIFSEHNEKKGKQKKKRMGGGADIFGIESDINMDLDEDIFVGDGEEEDDEENTRFVLHALMSSRESLKKLMGNGSPSSQQFDIVTAAPEKLRAAENLVAALQNNQVAYRVLDSPIGNVRNIPHGKSYCVEGFFLPCTGTEYIFICYDPMTQYKALSADGKNVEPLIPSMPLCRSEFCRTYANPLEVLDANELYICPPPFAPCINVENASSPKDAICHLMRNASRRSALSGVNVNTEPLVVSSRSQNDMHSQYEKRSVQSVSSQHSTVRPLRRENSISQEIHNQECHTELVERLHLSTAGSSQECHTESVERLQLSTASSNTMSRKCSSQVIYE